jgi:DNA-binding MarR family transcriptional regulator
LNDSEYLLVQGIARSSNVTQRELSEQAGLSLGMTNLLLKRLVAKGYVKVRQLNWRKVQYILTVRGAVEKAKKSCVYALRSYNEVKKMASVIRAHVLEAHRGGLREFTIVVPPQLADLVREAVAGLDLTGVSFSFETDLGKALARSETVFSAMPAAGALADGKTIIPILEPRSI